MFSEDHPRIVSVMGYSAEMELTNIRRRTAEGRAVAKSRGVKFGMKRKYDQHQIAEIMRKRELITTLQNLKKIIEKSI